MLRVARGQSTAAFHTAPAICSVPPRRSHRQHSQRRCSLYQEPRDSRPMTAVCAVCALQRVPPRRARRTQTRPLVEPGPGSCSCLPEEGETRSRLQAIGKRAAPGGPARARAVRRAAGRSPLTVM